MDDAAKSIGKPRKTAGRKVIGAKAGASVSANGPRRRAGRGRESGGYASLTANYEEQTMGNHGTQSQGAKARV